jgi:hypothetical protein
MKKRLRTKKKKKERRMSMRMKGLLWACLQCRVMLPMLTIWDAKGHPCPLASRLSCFQIPIISNMALSLALSLALRDILATLHRCIRARKVLRRPSTGHPKAWEFISQKCHLHHKVIMAFQLTRHILLLLLRRRRHLVQGCQTLTKHMQCLVKHLGCRRLPFSLSALDISQGTLRRRQHTMVSGLCHQT